MTEITTYQPTVQSTINQSNQRPTESKRSFSETTNKPTKQQNKQLTI
jgi:hypothetical protein